MKEGYFKNSNRVNFIVKTKSLQEKLLMLFNTGEYTSMNQVLQRLVDLGLEAIEKPTIKKPEEKQTTVSAGVILNKLLSLQMHQLNNFDDIYVILNILLKMVASLFNAKQKELEEEELEPQSFGMLLYSELPELLEPMMQTIISPRKKKIIRGDGLK